MSVVTEKVTVDTFFNKIKKHIFNAINRVSVQKPSTVVAYNSPGRFLLLIREKVLVVFKYVIINR